MISLDNDFKKLDRFFKRYYQEHEIRACYEASGSGYGLCRWMREKDYGCEVIAPSLIPKKPVERRKTDSRNAK